MVVFVLVRGQLVPEVGSLPIKVENSGVLAKNGIRPVLEFFVGLAKNLVEDHAVFIGKVDEFFGFFGQFWVDEVGRCGAGFLRGLGGLELRG